MKYRTLANTGTSVSNLALGAMGFGTETEESEALPARPTTSCGSPWERQVTT